VLRFRRSWMFASEHIYSIVWAPSVARIECSIHFRSSNNVYWTKNSPVKIFRSLATKILFLTVSTWNSSSYDKKWHKSNENTQFYTTLPSRSIWEYFKLGTTNKIITFRCLVSELLFCKRTSLSVDFHFSFNILVYYHETDKLVCFMIRIIWIDEMKY